MKKTYPMGSISEGTMREEDLIPEFVYTLRQLAKRARNREHLKLCARIQTDIDAHIDMENGLSGKAYFGTETASFDLNEDLFYSLNEYAAPYFYFGSHPGDGSDYGFWLSEDMENEFDGLKVEDLSEVPKDYAGEVIVINDHGNMSLYHKARTQKPREIWAVV